MSTNLSDLPWQQGDYREKGLRAELEDFRSVDQLHPCAQILIQHILQFLGRAWKALTSRWHDDSAWLEAKKGSPVHSAPGSPDYVRRPNKIASKKTGHDDDVPALVSFAHVIASPHMRARSDTHCPSPPTHFLRVTHSPHCLSLSLALSHTGAWPKKSRNKDYHGQRWRECHHQQAADRKGSTSGSAQLVPVALCYNWKI